MFSFKAKEKVKHLDLNISLRKTLKTKESQNQFLISYSFLQNPFGDALMASTTKGICYIALGIDNSLALADLKKRFPFFAIKHEEKQIHKIANATIGNSSPAYSSINVHLIGTAFQLKVWEALSNIPTGILSTYAKIATKIGAPKAQRAVGTAIANNPVAYLIPCHRVIRSTGEMGEYRWGKSLKKTLIQKESKSS